MIAASVGSVVTVVPYGEPRPAGGGIYVGYCNLFDELNTGNYGPYLKTSDTAKQYREGQIDPRGAGWTKNLTEQFELRKRQGFEYIELDNPDAYSIEDVIGAIDLAATYGLKVIAKNPMLFESESARRAFVRHHNIHGAIVERDCGDPAGMAKLRTDAGKPDLPVWFVAFGAGLSWANEMARAAKSYRDMRVTYSDRGEYGTSRDLDTDIGTTVMADVIPEWLPVARRYLGVEEIGGRGDNPTILKFATTVAAKFPTHARYASQYVSDDTAWCGVAAADWFSEVGIEPPFGPSDTDKWMWADAWMPWGKPSGPRVGAVVCFGRHVALVNRLIDADTFEAIGGNQSSPQGGAVTLSRRRWSEVKATRWPDTGAVVVVPPVPGERPEIKFGSTDPSVLELQRLLGIAQTGIFDTTTDAAVRAFQASRGLDVDGEVGPITWPALLAATATGRPSGLTQKTIDTIVAAAASSRLARFNWPNRGVAPIGYTKGMAVTFGLVYSKFKAGNSSALAMGAMVPASAKDALELYASAFNAAGIILNASGIDNLRALFVLEAGLGLRESSGRYCEGRDRSASNTSADSAEAGLFQQSWDSRGASPELPKLFAAYRSNPRGFVEIFQEGVSVRAGDLDNSGSGDGAAFQALCKSAPAFAVECAAVGLRVLRTHWGPIVRREVEITPFADELFRHVQTIVDAQPIDGDVIPPTRLDDELLIALIFILTEGTNMDANIKAQMIAELGKPNPNLRALLLQALGAPGTTLPPLLPPVVPPVPPPPAFDYSAFLPLLQSPIVQQILGGKPITIAELLPLIPAILAISSGQPVPALPPPPKPTVVTPPPVVPVPPATSTAFNWSAGIGAALASLGLSATGVIGAPLGPDATTPGMLIPLLSLAAGAFGIPAPLVSIFGNLFTNMMGATKPKAP